MRWGRVITLLRRPFKAHARPLPSFSNLDGGRLINSLNGGRELRSLAYAPSARAVDALRTCGPAHFMANTSSVAARGTLQARATRRFLAGRRGGRIVLPLPEGGGRGRRARLALHQHAAERWPGGLVRTRPAPGPRPRRRPLPAGGVAGARRGHPRRPARPRLRASGRRRHGVLHRPGLLAREPRSHRGGELRRLRPPRHRAADPARPEPLAARALPRPHPGLQGFRAADGGAPPGRGVT